MLGDSQLSHLVDQSGFYSSWFETAGPMDLVIYTLASFHLPLNIFIICVLFLYPKSKVTYHQPRYLRYCWVHNWDSPTQPQLKLG